MAKSWLKFPTEWLDRYSDKPEYIVFLLHCIDRAAWESKTIFGIELNRGDFITTRANFSAILGLTENQYRNRLKNLIEDGVLCTKNVPKQKTIISICDFDTYFGDDYENNQEVTKNAPRNNQETTNEYPTNNQQITHNIDIDIDIDIYKKKKKKNGEIFNQRKAELIAAGVQMTDEGLEQFIELNEHHPQFAPFGLGYKRGVVQSAILFLKRRENAEYRIVPDRRGGNTPKGTPPSSAAPPRWQTQPHEVFATKIQNIVRQHPENPDIGMWLSKISCVGADAQGMTVQISKADYQEIQKRNITGYINAEFRQIRLNVIYV